MASANSTLEKNEAVPQNYHDFIMDVTYKLITLKALIASSITVREQNERDYDENDYDIHADLLLESALENIKLVHSTLFNSICSYTEKVEV